MIQVILEILFEICCGWVGRGVVKLLTFGKIDLDSDDHSIAAPIGLIVLLLLLIGTVALIRTT